MVDKVINELIKLGNNKDKEIIKYFFKTNKGDYSYNDSFLGIKVPVIRTISKKYKDILSLEEIEKLLQNEYHEVRELALFLLTLNYKKYPKEVYDIYLNNLKYVNNWDLVDQSASNILGKHIYDNKLSRDIIYKLSNSKDMWEQRVSIISTHYFIKNNDLNDTLKLSKKFLNTKHDLIKKAVGWSLREVGKKDYNLLYNFLNYNIKDIQGITFSYATEHFDKKEKEQLKSKKQIIN